MIPQNIIEAIAFERAYQDAKWGTPREHPHDVGAWITIMRKELREAEDAWCGGRGDLGALVEIGHVIAVGIACMEQHGAPTRCDEDAASAESGEEKQSMGCVRPEQASHQTSFETTLLALVDQQSDEIDRLKRLVCDGCSSDVPLCADGTRHVDADGTVYACEAAEGGE